MIIWPDQIANAVVTTLDVTDEMWAGGITMMVVVLWIMAYLAATAAVCGALYAVYCIIRGCWAWVCEGVEDSLKEDGRS